MPRPKYKRPHEIKLQVPKNEGKYRLKRLYWTMLEMEKRMSKDITSVKYADYAAVLKDFTELAGQLKMKGVVEYRHEKDYTGARVDDKEAKEDSSEESGPSEAGGDGPSGVGSGIPAVNPLT